MRGEPLKCEKVVIIKNLFSPEDFDKEVQLLLEYQQDIRSECLKCGDVRKVVIYDVSFGLFLICFSLVLLSRSSYAISIIIIIIILYCLRRSREQLNILWIQIRAKNLRKIS